MTRLPCCIPFCRRTTEAKNGLFRWRNMERGGGMMALGNRRDLTGHRNGRLVAIKLVQIRASDSRAMWLCKCDCGGEKIVQSNNLTRESGTKSCGCLRRESGVKRRKRDGVWNDGKSYSIENGQRCYKGRHSWSKAAIRHYGNKCEKCGWDKARCDVHHRIPKAKGGLHTIENAVVLCPNCHREAHEAEK